MILRNLALFYLLCFTQVASFGQGNCCCGTPKELDFPGFDFEIPPDPVPGWFNTFAAGETMGAWDITKGYIDQVDKAHYYNTGYGNPNGPSTFADLFGSPPNAASASGALRYTLTGLTPAYQYTLEFYYAKFDVPGTFIATIKVANGAWLNVGLTATNPGNIIWLKASYPFVALSSSANLEFIDAGSSSCCGVGVLIDDIKIFECPYDLEKPVVNNPPNDMEVECDNEVPVVPTLDISDNCDLNTSVTFKETKDIIDACTKKITREWTIKDACGNSTIQKQIIDVIDKTQPQFSKFPENKIAYCTSDVIKEFNDWIKKNGNAIATDGCGAVSWRTVNTRVPKKSCDSIAVDFIAIDPCGHEITESAFFIVKDTSGSKFSNKPQDKFFAGIPNIRDSLRSWLYSNGFSTIKTGCDTAIFSSNFDGDSTKNPIQVTFYVKDHCGNIDSASASFSYQSSSVTCCCGLPKEMDFPGFDFEIGPFPTPGGFIPYVAVNPFGPWLVTNGAIDIGDKDYCGFLAAGNPNGPSYFIDLFGSPPTGSVAGTLEYVLTGLTSGYTYTIEFWYATFTANGSFSANLKVANGAWLNVNWTANNPGSVIWLKKTYSFTAKAASATLSFTDTGSSSSMYQIGMLLDDLKIFECPNDLEKPIVNNPPDNIEVECDKDVPGIPKLDISDNCDLNPSVTIKETKDIIDACTKKITREWTIKDACGNITIQNQIIDVIDKTQPQFSKYPEPKIAYCDEDVVKEFNDWIKKNGNAIAADACGAVSWRTVYARLPKKLCDSVAVDFIAIDQCGHEIVETAYFIVQNATPAKFIIKPQNKSFPNGPDIRDSLQAWLNSFGFSSNSSTSCDTIILSSNFDGDSTKNPIQVTFYVKDRCGNIDSSSASFTIQAKGSKCCCGIETELFYPNLDFEAPPIAPAGGWFDYYAGDNYAGWQINTGSVSIHSPTHLNLGAGNPNGASQHMDLHGATQGSATYTLTGLTAGSNYTIAFWYAIHSFGSNVSARLQVNGGSLLNVSWNATNTGDVVWLPAMYDFIADGTTADMTFIGTGATPCCGMLIDDIQIFECPGDKEKPVVTNPPDDLVVECEKDVPAPLNLNVSDNCDPSPKITLKEDRQTIDPCTKRVTRNWEIKDACGNITMQSQIIDIVDRNPPVFTKKPDDKLVYCTQDINKEFNDWIKKNGNSIAMDNCGPVTWRTDFDHAPKKYCDTVIVSFIAIDHCGNEGVDFGNFIVKDTSAPKFTIQAQDKNFVCQSNSRDSLRAWLENYGYSKTTGDCDTVLLSSNFNGDSARTTIKVTFYAKDRCGNIDSSIATFAFRSASDTFGVTTLSCNYPQSSIDTLTYHTNGCDSVVIYQKIKKPSDTTYIKLNTCNPLQKQFDTIQLRNVFFCDSTLLYEYVFKQTPVTDLQIMDCSFLVYSKDTVIQSGQYCDSLIITERIPLRIDSIIVQNTTCDKTKADTVLLYLKNSLGCDSIVSVQTIYTGQQNTFRILQECAISKDFIDTVKYTNGFCDSLVITQHIALSKDTTNIQSTNCDITKVGVFSKKLSNRFGCDSVVIEDISLLPSDSVSISNTTCMLSQAGTSVQQFKNKFNCDSVVTTKTIFIPSDTAIFNSFTCDISKQRHDTIIKSTALCDSVIITKIDFIQPDTMRSNNFTCDISQQGIVAKTFKTNFCDSVVITNTQFIPSDTISIILSTCIPSEVGLDTLALQNAKGCDSLVFTNRQFVPKQLLFQLDSISCNDKNDGKITILNTNTFSNPIDLILNNKFISNNPFAGNLGPGNYNFMVKDKDGCISDSFSFQLINPSAFTTELGSDLFLDPGQQIKLNLSSNKIPAFIYWSPQGISTCVQCQEIDYTASQDEWIYTLAIDERGCESKDSIFIRLRKATKIFAPNAISTNGDNINDYFYLIGDDNVIIELMEIYDRWGELLFSTTNIPPNQPELGWNGIFKGEKMNPGVYVYYARVKHPSGVSEVLKGDFTLIR